MQAHPRSLATTWGISVDFFSSGYLDVSVLPVRLHWPMYSARDTLAGGFPHSEIGGSKLHCQLPPALRRLARPSSPVIAKASTTCTSSLDPITLHSSHPETTLSFHSRLCASPLCWFKASSDANAITQPMQHLSHQQILHTSSNLLKIEQPSWLILPGKNQNTTSNLARSVLISGGGSRDRTDDPRLAKPVLSQLSYAPLTLWWVR